MIDVYRPKDFSESERGKIARIKRIRAAERAERERLETQELWKRCHEEDWVSEALELQRARKETERAAKLAEEIKAAAELEQVRQEVLAETSTKPVPAQDKTYSRLGCPMYPPA